MTTERFMQILAQNGLTIDELDCSPTRKALAKRLTSRNEESKQLDSVLRMSGIDIPDEVSEYDLAYRRVINAATAFEYSFFKGCKDDHEDNMDIFKTVAVGSQPTTLSGVKSAALDFAKAIVEFEKQGSFNALWQDGCNKSFCKLYNLMVGELGSDWRLAV